MAGGNGMAVDLSRGRKVHGMRSVHFFGGFCTVSMVSPNAPQPLLEDSLVWNPISELAQEEHSF